MHVALLNHYAGSPRHGMEFRPHQLARYWVQMGHTVTIAAGSWSHLRNQNPNVEGAITEEQIDGIDYRWYQTRPYDGNGLARFLSMRDYVRHIDRDRTRFFRSSPPDCVIASSTYPFDVGPARRLAKQSGAPLIWEIHDLWPLTQIELFGFSKLHPFVLLTHRAEGTAARKADRVVSILPRAIDHLQTRGLDPNRYVHIPNGISPEESAKAMQEPPINEAMQIITDAKSRNRSVVVYAGGHAPNHDLETLLDAAEAVKDEPFTFILIGSGPSKKSLEARAAKTGLSKFHFLPRASRGSALSTMKLADILYAGIAPGPLYRFGIGLNKIFDAMYVGKPIVGAYTSCNDPIQDAECGISSDTKDVKGVVNALRTIHSMPQNLRDQMGQRGHDFVIENHDYEKLANRFLDVIQDAQNSVH